MYWISTKYKEMHCTKVKSKTTSLSKLEIVCQWCPVFREQTSGT